MRGVTALLAWAGLLALAGALNAVWTGKAIQIGTFAFAVSAILLLAAVLAATAPARTDRPQAITRSSFATALAAAGLAVLLFGLTFGHFLVYFGAGMIVVGLARLLLELRAQRRASR